MPTDPNNLKPDQITAVKMRAYEDNPDFSFDAIFLNMRGERVTGIERTDIITDYPPKPSVEGEWECVRSTPFMGGAVLAAREEGYEYRIQRRPIKPAWEPTVGERAWWVNTSVIVNYLGKTVAVVTTAHGGIERYCAIKSLTQPKDQPE
jgi:hypothetical protein